MIEQLADGLLAWPARHPEWHPGKWGAEVFSFAVAEPGRTLLIDPLVPDGLWEDLDRVVAGSVEIAITIPYHVRSAEQWLDRLDVVWVIGSIHLRRDLQRQSRGLGDGDGPVEPLFGSDAAKEGEIAAARTR